MVVAIISGGLLFLSLILTIGLLSYYFHECRTKPEKECEKCKVCEVCEVCKVCEPRVPCVCEPCVCEVCEVCVKPLPEPIKTIEEIF